MKPKHLYLILLALLLACVALIVLPEVVHTNVDKSVDKIETKNETPSPTPRIQADPLPVEDSGKGAYGGASGVSATVRKNDPAPVPTEDPCEQSKAEAKAAGWHILSCDPLRIMPLEEWKTKTSSDNYQYRPDLYCFDESNFAGVFKEQLGEMVDGYYPDWLSEMILDNGCSFFFHPTQGRENAPADVKD